MVAIWRFVGIVVWTVTWTSLAQTVGGEPPPARFPSLINATIDDIRMGLEGGLFTSVDLVNVSENPIGWQVGRNLIVFRHTFVALPRSTISSKL